MSDILLEISQKIINLFDISIIVFEKKDNEIYYLYGNEYFIKNNQQKLIYNTFNTMFPEYNKESIHNTINTILSSSQMISFIENGNKLKIYSIDQKYIVFCITLDMIQDNTTNTRTKILLNNMNHAIRTPLNGITGTINLLLTSDLDDEQYSHIQNIQSSCFILINVITDLLDFLKLETKNLKLSVSPFNIIECIDACMNMIQKKATLKGLAIHTVIHPNVHKYMIGDLSRIKQIILNILDNAVKFTNEGFVKIEVFQDRDIIIKISDSGIGMTDEEKNELFKILDTLPTFRKQLIGLGLPITKYLIDLMDGKIEVDSQQNNGSVFTIKLPLKNYEMAEKQHRKNKTILILHSNYKERINISKMLINQNFAHILTSSVEEALLFSQDTEFDLLIIDDEKYINMFPNISKILLGKFTKGKRPENIQILRENYDYEQLKQLIIETLMVPIGNNNHRILNVEDVEINRIINEKMLDSLGFKKYKSVSNGIEAYEELKQNEYDIVLLDIKLPHKSGLELIDDLISEKIQLPYIIVMTAYVTDDLTSECNTRNVNDILYKPIEMDQLQLALKRAQRFLS